MQNQDQTETRPKGCYLETFNNKNMYAWSAGGNITVMKPDGTKIFAGKGNLPLVKAMNINQDICI